MAAVQRHRVDCSMQATYELWTQIDPSWTGLVMPAGIDTVRALPDLPAIAPDARGVVPIRVVLRSKPGFATFEKIISVVQRVALAGRYAHVAVEFGPPLKGLHGINLVVGAPGELQDLPGYDPSQMVGGQALTFLSATTDRSATLIVPGIGAAELDAASAVLTATASREAAGSPQGLRLLQLARGLEIDGGATLPLARFGVPNREFSGRLFRTGFDVSLPADFIPADYAKANLALAGGYAAGLETGAQIIIDVNGRNVASNALPRSDGDVFRNAVMPLPLSRWRPGRNHVEITALLPSATDRTCADSGADRKRFLFLNDTTLTLPPLARALRLPDLAVTTSGGLPYAGAAHRPRLVVPTPDREIDVGRSHDCRADGRRRRAPDRLRTRQRIGAAAARPDRRGRAGACPRPGHPARGRRRCRPDPPDLGAPRRRRDGARPGGDAARDQHRPAASRRAAGLHAAGPGRPGRPARPPARPGRRSRRRGPRPRHLLDHRAADPGFRGRPPVRRRVHPPGRRG
ncbi:cellulose biosynthesis cyclic di-GMP-binding regulatory protein BcsB [Methylobacterium phyllosphaerae]